MTTPRPRRGWCTPCVDWLDAMWRDAGRGGIETWLNDRLLEAFRASPPSALPLYEFKASRASDDPYERPGGFVAAGSLCLAGASWGRERFEGRCPDFCRWFAGVARASVVESKINKRLEGDQLAHYARMARAGVWETWHVLVSLGNPHHRNLLLLANEHGLSFLPWEDVLRWLDEEPLVDWLKAFIEAELTTLVDRGWLDSKLQEQRALGRLPDWWITHRDDAASLRYWWHCVEEFQDRLLT